MRESAKGLQTQKPFQIKEMEEKSHFSPPQATLQIQENNLKFQERVSRDPDSPTLSKNKPQQAKSPEKQQKKESSSSKKLINFLNSESEQNQVGENQPTKNLNSNFSQYTLIMYLGIFLYLCDFFVLIIPGLRESSNISRATEVALETLFVIVSILMILSYEKARRANPGYPTGLQKLLKTKNAKEAYDTSEIQQLQNNTMTLLIKKAELKEAFSKDPSKQNQQAIDAFEYQFCVEETKWCDKCCNIKKPRVRHCSECNKCIQRMDHHCVWLNNCVGKKNHKFFMLFLFFLIVLLSFFTIVGILEFFDHENSVSKYLQSKYGGGCKIIYFIGEIFAIGLWVYYTFVFFEQLYLIFNNLTFVESLTTVLLQKKPWKKDSCYENLREVFGTGCWVCPTKLNSTSHINFGQGQDKKNPSSAQLVEQVHGGNSNPITNFESEQHFGNQKNQI